MDNQANGSTQIAGIRNAMVQIVQKITEHPMAAENTNVYIRRRMNNTENIVHAIIRGKIELFIT